MCHTVWLIRRNRIKCLIVVNAYFTVLNLSGCIIIRLQHWPEFADFWPFEAIPALKPSSSELAILLFCTLITYNNWRRTANAWVSLGRIGSIWINPIELYACFVLTTYLTALNVPNDGMNVPNDRMNVPNDRLNVPNDRMIHPWIVCV